MKFIQTLISDDMSMNSVKPSIKSESEGTLDSCIMKEAPVSDCVLSKEINSQNNGEKDLCLTGYEIGSVGNTTKKMFEQVDLNSSISNSEVPVKKDSWNSGDLYDNTSEKENMESTDVRYDALSDDDNESIHLKISSDDENSIADSETIEQNSPCNKTSGNSMDEGEFSQDMTDGENAHSHCEAEDDHQTASNESCRKNMNSSSTSGRDAPRNSDETEEKISLESDHEDSIEEFEPMPSSSESQLSHTNYNNTFDTMVSEEKSTPTSPETLTSEKDSEILESNNENTSEESLLGIDQNMLPNGTEGASECDSSSKNSVTSDAQLDDLARVDENSKEAELSREENSRPITLDSDAADTEKEVILLSDDANDSDSCIDSNEINGLKISDQKTDEESSNENLEEETVCSGEFEEIETEQKDDENPESAEGEDSMKGKGKLLNAGKECDTFLEGEPSIKESADPEEKFLEILEYQPINEEGEELREIQTDKDIHCEVEQKTALADENELLNSSDLCTEKQKGNNKLPSVPSNSKDSDHSNNTTDTEASPPNSPEANTDCLESAEHSAGSKEQVDIAEECDTSVDKETVQRGPRRLVSSDYEVFSDSNKTVDNAEADNDIKLLSNTASAEKTDPLTESCEAQSGRKRTSSSEENLVICSKRTKVEITEKENKESELVVCEETTVSDYKKQCTEVDTKEKRDIRAKRLSNSVSDPVEVKKIRVMPEASRGEKDEKTSRLDKGDTNLEVAKKSEEPVESKKESDNSARNPMPFLRTFSRTQLQKMSRNDLEELVLQKICEAITDRTECGELRELAQSLEEKLKIWQKKSVQLAKQIKDLNVVLKRYGSDLQNKGPNSAPLKITRSVGLQVQMPGASSTSWNSEESTRRKSEKSSASTASASSSVTNSAKAGASSPVSKPSASNVNKVSEDEVQVSTAPTRQNSQSSPQSAGAKVPQTKSPASSNSGPANTNKTSNKSQPSSNNRVKSSSDLQVIDLTDAEEKTKNNSKNLPAVSSTTTTSSAPVPVVSTTVASSNTVTNVNIANVSRPIRVVQHLGGSTAPILTQTGANALTGQRVAYFVPTTSVPSQQRQLIISSPSQVRPAGVVSMSRQNPLPTIVLKPGQVVSSVSGPGIIRTSNINSLQLASPRAQPRTGHLIQRFPVSASSVQSSALAVAQSGLSVSSSSTSSSSHPAPLPPTPPSGPNNTNWKRPPPKPDLKISKVPNRNQQGIVLSWNMTVTQEYEEIASYQLFAYQEGNAPPSTHLWKKVGDVKALPLPMACTLTQFMEGHKYHFAVRAVDVYARYGPFSAPGNIVLTRN